MAESENPPFWQWYGTRVVWATIGHDYCPFCEGEMVASVIFWTHLILGFAIGFGIEKVTGNLLLAAVPFLILGAVGGRATIGFLNHLHGWQEDTYEAVEEVAAQNDLDVVKIPTEE